MQHYNDVATLGATKGLRGELTLKPSLIYALDYEADSFADGIIVNLVPPRIDVPRQVCLKSLTIAPSGKGSISFFDIDDVSAAEQIVGMHCLIDDSSLEVLGARTASENADCSIEPSYSNEIEFKSLEGWSVEDLNSGFRGEVCRCSSPAGQILLDVIGSDEACSLIPLVDDFIADMDEDAHIIKMKLPKGLIEL